MENKRYRTKCVRQNMVDSSPHQSLSHRKPGLPANKRMCMESSKATGAGSRPGGCFCHCWLAAHISMQGSILRKRACEGNTSQQNTGEAPQPGAHAKVHAHPHYIHTNRLQGSQHTNIGNPKKKKTVSKLDFRKQFKVQRRIHKMVNDEDTRKMV